LTRDYSVKKKDQGDLKMAETLGSLVDKLTIANIRLWHLEDVRRDKTLSSQKRLAAADMVSIVNGERNDLMDEIDEFIYQAAHGKVKLKAPKVKIYKKFKIDPKAKKLAENLARTQSTKKTTKKIVKKTTKKKTTKKTK
jgi:DNA invertase Pin-like site-specific DNA recombinase